MSDYCGYPPSALSFMFPPSSHHFPGHSHPSLGHDLATSAFLRERAALLGIPSGPPPPGQIPGHPGMIRPSPMSMSGPWRPGMPPGGGSDMQNLMAVSAAAAASGYPSWYIAAALALQRGSSGPGGPNPSPYGGMSWPPLPSGGHQSSSGSLPLAPPGGMMMQNSLNPNRSSPPGGDNRGQPFSGFSTKKEPGVRTESPPIVIVNSSTNSP